MTDDQTKTLDNALVSLANDSKAWPFEEARKLVARAEKRGLGGKDYLLFETGYGPSGLPHIGTFGEVARTSMVRHAFSVLSDIPTKLVCFSDDMDGLRKVPDNVPNQQMMQQQLGKPLTSVPDPFSNEHTSFGAANNARLRVFLDRFSFDYEFESATENYKSGRFNDALMRMLEVYDKVMDIILPTLGPERRATYSPFLPICPRTGVVLQVPLVARDVAKGIVTYEDPETGDPVDVSVKGGAVKCQWKADWALRWFALGVDYEMAGKDLIESVKLSSRICRAMGGEPPEGFNYELFLDENGEKISKSRGNGLTIDEWLRYASTQSLSNFMFASPRKAKRLYFDVIPKNVDEYLSHLASYPKLEPAKQLANPVWHIHDGKPPADEAPISFNILLNLVSASNSEDKDVLWGFISRYVPGATPQTDPLLDEMVGYAITYFHDFVKPAKTFRSASEQEAKAMQDLSDRLGALDASADAETIQNEVFAVGKEHGFDPLRSWFSALYEVLLGQSQGPRFGSFVALYGINETRQMIAAALKKNTAL
ncbi:MAG: lysine--tRNA ligase [Candidatus Phaeomarinobacter sp.]